MSSPNTGPTVPGWIRDEIARHEADWPRLALAAGMIGVIGLNLAIGAFLWSLEPAVYYAHP